jgi:ankyrin repeat protein
MHIAATMGSAANVALLLSKNAAWRDTVSPTRCCQAIHMAAARGHVDVLRVLGDSLSSVDVADATPERESPLFYAVRGGKLDAVRCLVAMAPT